MQELRVFLEADGVLALAPEWQQLQPASGNLLDGVTRLPKQLFGAYSSDLVSNSEGFSDSWGHVSQTLS